MPQTISPAEAKRRIDAGAVLIDIRNPDEYARAHIPCARNVPMSRIDRIEGAPEVIFHCKSGMRTAANADALAACTDAPVFLLEGGIEAWQKSGLDCNVDKKQPPEIMRQVQIGAGSPVLLRLSAFVGAGLAMAGTTGGCGMARLLAVMPWNRRPA